MMIFKTQSLFNLTLHDLPLLPLHNLASNDIILVYLEVYHKGRGAIAIMTTEDQAILAQISQVAGECHHLSFAVGCKLLITSKV
jgi:hypothetical protein